MPAKQRVEESDEAEEAAREMGLINAFGMFWDRDRVQWKSTMPRLLGVQQSGSEPVNFTEQAGVYVHVGLTPFGGHRVRRLVPSE